MGRRKLNPVYKHFSLNSVEKAAKCKLGCNATIKGPSASNLEKHIKRHHPAIFNSLEAEKTVKPSSTGQTSAGGVGAELVLKRSKTIEEHFYPKISIDMDLSTFNSAMIELVTVNGRPFSAVEDSGLLKILNPIKKALNVAMDRKKIVELVRSSAKDISCTIEHDLKDKMFSLKLDIASRLDRSVLAINAQYINEEGLQLRTLCVKEFPIQHSGENIKGLVLEVLSNYNLSIQQVFTITTDNARNMIRAVDLLSCTAEEHEINDANDHEIEHSEDDIELEFSSVISVKCAAHTLQLVVKDAIGDGLLSKTISQARTLSKKLRTPLIMNVLKSKNLKMPIVDVVTRWCSLYDMLDRLLELRPFIEDISSSLGPEFILASSLWKKIEEIVDTLRPVKSATVKLQAENLTPGDFYRIWLVCKSDVGKIQCPLSISVIEAMIKREKCLLHCQALLSSIYLDPRFNVVLSDEQKLYAVKHLEQLNSRSQKIKHGNQLNLNQITEHGQLNSSSSSGDELEKMLGALEKRSNSADRIEIELEDFCTKVKRIDKDKDIIQWWKESKATHSNLYDLACIVHAVPMTQVSVERVFSALKFIMSDVRRSMAAEALENVLIVRCNTSK